MGIDSCLLALLSSRYFGGNFGGMDAAIEPPPRMDSRRFPENLSQGGNTRSSESQSLMALACTAAFPV
jgi:hypothetical protein